MVIVFNILIICQTVFQSMYHFTFITAAYESSISTPSSPTLGVGSLFNVSNFSKWVVIFHCGLNCISLMMNDAEYLFLGLFAIIIFFGEVSV